jgi:hypothetical protein
MALSGTEVRDVSYVPKRHYKADRRDVDRQRAGLLPPIAGHDSADESG